MRSFATQDLLLFPNGNFNATHLSCLGAAGPVNTAAGRVQRGRRLTGQHLPESSRLTVGVRDRHGVEQASCVWVPHFSIETLCRSELHHPPEVEHQHALTKASHDGEVVTDEQDTHPVLALQIRKECQDLLLDRYVQGTHGLITDQ
jgi:hypothetical protein